MKLRTARKILDCDRPRRTRTVIRACRRLDYAHRETVAWIRRQVREERYDDGGILIQVGPAAVYLAGM
jgi:hypothetical protein